MGCSPRAERRTPGAATDTTERPAAAAAVLRTLRLVGSACGLLRLLFIALSLSSAFLNTKASIVSPPVPSKSTTGQGEFPLDHIARQPSRNEDDARAVIVTGPSRQVIGRVH